MECPTCGNNMRIKQTFRGQKYWHRRYICDFCGYKTKIKFEAPVRG